MAPLVRTGGSRHTGLAALPHRNIHELETTSWDAKSQSDKNTTNSTEENTALSLEKKEIDISGLKKQYKLIVLSIVLILFSYAKQVEKNVLRKIVSVGINKSKVINRKYGKEPYEEK